MTLKEAQAKHGAAKVERRALPWHECDRAVCEGEQDGYISLVYRTSDLKILGATIVNGKSATMASDCDCY